MLTTRIRLAGLAGAAIGALLLAGCSADADAPTPTPTLTHEGPTSAPSPTPMPTVGNQDDALCAAAQQNLELSTEVLGKSEELQALLQDPAFLTGGDVETLNAWGADMLVLTEDSLSFYDIGVNETAGDPVNEDFAAMKSFIADYSVPLAQLAAEAESPGVFTVQASTIVMQPETREVISAAPAAGQRIAAYLAERCAISV